MFKRKIDDLCFDAVQPAGSADAQIIDTQTHAARASDDWDFSDVLDQMKAEYQTSGRPLVVNFRKLVPLHSGIDRATHLIHSYPAKLLINIPLFFLRCEQVGPAGRLLDPFCGSGTVLVEGALNGWQLAGADANPLARLITKTKLTHVKTEAIAEAVERISSAPALSSTAFAPVVDVDMWFSKPAQIQIGSLLDAIAREPEAELRQFLQICLSSCVRKASFADPRLSVPVRVKPGSKEWNKAGKPNVTDLFIRAVDANGRRVAELGSIEPSLLRGLSLLEDARSICDEPKSGSDIDLVITSPPYVGAQKYVRASSLSIGWLGLAPGNKLRPLERANIGREHYLRFEYSQPNFPEDGLASVALERIRKINPLRAHIASTYLAEMREALTATARRLKRGGWLILVIGNNTICGEEFETSNYIAQIAVSIGLDLELELLDDIRSRGLMTKRNKTAGVISREHIQMFRKP